METQKSTSTSSKASLVCEKRGDGLPVENQLHIHPGTNKIKETHTCNVCSFVNGEKKMHGKMSSSSSDFGKPESSNTKEDAPCSSTNNTDELASGGKIYICEHCGKRFRCLHTLYSHEVIHYGATPYICTVCGEASARSYDILTRKKFISGELLFECEFCNKRIFRQRSFKCYTCGKLFLTSSQLIAHMRIHEKNNQYTCFACGKTYSQLHQLKDHEKIHTQVDPFKCDHCDKDFVNSCSLKRHINYAHRKKPYKCFDCNERFDLSILLERHRTVHRTGVGPIKPMAYSLKLHLKSITGNVLYICDQCNKTFKSTECLQKHKCHQTHGKNREQLDKYDLLPMSEVDHSGERLFKCNQCNEAFQSKHDLQKHEITHTEPRPHTCKDCGKGFKKLSSLTAHMEFHSRAKPFGCQQCGKGFALSHHLIKHMATHTEQRQFQCDQCGVFFPCKETFESHCSEPCVIIEFSKIRGKEKREPLHFKQHQKQTGEIPFKCEVQKNQTTIHQKSLKCMEGERTQMIKQCVNIKEEPHNFEDNDFKPINIKHIKEEQFQCNIKEEPYSHKNQQTIDECRDVKEEPYDADETGHEQTIVISDVFSLCESHITH